MAQQIAMMPTVQPHQSAVATTEETGAMVVMVEATVVEAALTLLTMMLMVSAKSKEIAMTATAPSPPTLKKIPPTASTKTVMGRSFAM